jgi:transcriptional regulator with PAS, ATPase and Fis domain
MKSRGTTIETESDLPDPAEASRPVPGLVVVPVHPISADARAAPLRAVSLAREGVVLGRGDEADIKLDDDRLSRAHVRVAFDKGSFVVEDLGSKNGTFVDGERLEGARSGAALRLARLGSHVALFVGDAAPFARAAVAVSEDVVVGPTLARVLAAIDAIAAGGNTLHVTGETGAGKELAARRFHQESGRPGAPFVALNCATVPAALAERLLFGARKGAFSGADANVEGTLHAADGGTLFLDEVVELDAALQAKLLRVLETGEVVRLGATQGERVSIRVCTATHADLRAEVAAGRFREDLYYRLARPTVRVPPLRERPEEVPYLVATSLARLNPRLLAHASLVEACLLRPWPGNVRELLIEVRSAAQLAIAEGTTLVRDKHLAADAGRPFADGPEPARRPSDWPDDAAIEAALAAEGGNESAAARRLRVHRTQLRRWLAKRKD